MRGMLCRKVWLSVKLPIIFKSLRKTSYDGNLTLVPTGVTQTPRFSYALWHRGAVSSTTAGMHVAFHENVITIGIDDFEFCVDLLYFQIQYNIIVRTGRRTYPRYFKLEFAFHRAKYTSQPRRPDPARTQLQAKIIELRSSGWSFPAIAKHLNISVGNAWNMANIFKKEY